MKVKGIWIRFPEGFIRNNFNDFYATLGNNIPKYLDYEGHGWQTIFCVQENVDVNSICERFGITEFNHSLFDVDPDLFNSDHQIVPNYGGNSKYKLE